MKKNHPKTPSPRSVNWDHYTLLLVVFSFVFVLLEVSSVVSYFLSTPAPVALLDDRPYHAPPRGRLLPLSAKNLNTLWGHIQRAALSGRLPGAQTNNFAASFNQFLAGLPQYL